MADSGASLQAAQAAPRSGKKAIPIPSNPAADDAAREAAATWLREHAQEPAIEPTFDAEGRQTNYKDRSEVVIHDAPTFKVVQYSDGTVRKDNCAPAAPRPVPVTVDTQYRYSKEDLARMTLNKEDASACNMNWFAK